MMAAVAFAALLVAGFAMSWAMYRHDMRAGREAAARWKQRDAGR